MNPPARQTAVSIENLARIQHPGSEDAYWFFLSYFLDAKDIEKNNFIASWSDLPPNNAVISEKSCSLGLLHITSFLF
jgi:hypothetical protein